VAAYGGTEPQPKRIPRPNDPDAQSPRARARTAHGDGRVGADEDCGDDDSTKQMPHARASESNVGKGSSMAGGDSRLQLTRRQQRARRGHRRKQATLNETERHEQRAAEVAALTARPAPQPGATRGDVRRRARQLARAATSQSYHGRRPLKLDL